jgi:rare lipoprotein A
MVVGDPYSVEGTSYTPEDVMNYDQVGFLAADSAGGDAVSGSHHTLPLPSYVEVISLETGKTILVRLERRGPMNSNELVALSPGALAQLEASRGTPVRVRRVNPPEDQRAMLRAGGRADPRMDTPMSLVEILKRRLPGQDAGSVSVAQAQPTAPPVAAAPSQMRPVVVAASTAAPAPAPTRAATALALPPLPQRGQNGASLPLPPQPTRVVASNPAPAAVQRPAAVKQRLHRAGGVVLVVGQRAQRRPGDRGRGPAGRQLLPGPDRALCDPWRSRGLARQGAGRGL